jgi:hypothetical protein
MAAASGRAWTLERATVHVAGKSRPRSNKYSASDSHPMPPAGTRTRFWVGGYTRADGTPVRGHYRRASRGRN